MKRQTLYAIGVAVVLGLFAVVLANSYLTSKRGSVAPEGTTRVAVASVPLDYGTELKPELIRFIDYPTDALPAGSFNTPADLVGGTNRRIVLAPIAANEVILAGKVTGVGAGASIAALLPDGKRAVSVRINDVSGVAGFVQPNDSVDVLITRQIANGDRSQQATDVLLQNTRIIAMGQRSKNDDGKPAVATTATLEVTPLDAQKLALGQQVGDLSLVLRKPGEQDGQELVETVSLEDLRFGTSNGGYRSQLASALVGPSQRVQVKRLAPPRTAPVRQAAPRVRPAQIPVTKNVGVVRGTTETNYDVGGFGG
jgi:pilus assembly protein CpaB